MSNMTSTPCDLETLCSRLEQEIRLGRLHLPVMPDVAVRATRAAGRAGSSAKDLARIIETDPALAARVLKMANSAMYAGLTEIRDLDRAIARLGATLVVAVTVGSASRDAFDNAGHPEFEPVLAQTWIASLFAAAAARLMAPQTDMVPEEGFLAGLLHAAGQPILLHSVIRLIRDGEIEQPALGTIESALARLAPIAGARLLSRWGLPRHIVEAVEHQAEPTRAPEAFRGLAAILGLAGSIGHQVASGASPESAARHAASHPALALLPGVAASLPQIAGRAANDAAAAAGVF